MPEDLLSHLTNPNAIIYINHLYLLHLCVYVFVCLCVCVCVYPQRPEEGAESLGDGVSSDCELLLDLGDRN